MKRALMYASVASMIQQFNMENIRLLLELGYEVDVACNMEQGSTITSEKIEAMKQELKEMGVNVVHVPIPRKVTAVGDIMKSFRASKQLMNAREYALIHCHSPIGGMICRLANRFSKGYGKTKMIYTAHGFHFFKGAPKKNWLIFYPVEWLCSRYTDVLITINHEDYTLAQKKMKARNVQYVPGIGVNTEHISKVFSIRDQLCEQLGIPMSAKLMISVGELNDNKNHQVVVRAMKDLPSDIHYLICGQGDSAPVLTEIAQQMDCEKRLHLLGYRSDVLAVVKSCDLFVFPSKREGLSVALMEAMAVGKAVACSKIRGNTDLIDENGGVLFDPTDVDACAEAIQTLLRFDLSAMGRYNADKIQSFSMERVSKMMKELYCSTPQKAPC